jgi:predicted N-acetyltransferase YhbS
MPGWRIAVRRAISRQSTVATSCVVEDNSHIVGFGEAVRGMIIAVYVDPGSVRRGVGSAIMHQALKVARQEHHAAIRLESTLNATGFYERFGFRAVERSSVIRGQVAVPVILMERQET